MLYVPLASGLGGRAREVFTHMTAPLHEAKWSFLTARCSQGGPPPSWWLTSREKLEAVSHIRPHPRTEMVLPCHIVLVKVVTGKNRFGVVVDTDSVS